MTLAFVLLLLAAICILLAAFNCPIPRGVNLFYLGIFFIVASWLCTGIVLR